MSTVVWNHLSAGENKKPPDERFSFLIMPATMGRSATEVDMPSAEHGFSSSTLENASAISNNSVRLVMRRSLKKFENTVWDII
ncbi:hypothetical protein SARC_03539 [Sphaeroforma arctica JP610]|uniref:Uncharacterized protein n=1 Tax=Sphaeroforma arctica JP610 TaxID=667725 RepID=A0A0L0G5L6_9EUKA|nr:hypothetical protein SARC_03539 [Sphaeroforma arctica JP610]KNC84239.1 hypothetical protein SARC_03539 [Sphaeroforma arctica JP610]|eukprot:XP_014158141.1 hypothetical protein SARC_03539 [Sphaeroforma arctica JP610]